MDPVYAVVLAGDSEDSKIVKGAVIPNKAFMQINGRNMVEYVLDCLKRTRGIADIAVLGPADRINARDWGVRCIPQQGDMIANVVAAAEIYKDGWLLLSSCDIPLLTPQAVEDFVANCRGAEMYYPLVARADCEKIFPDMQRTWVSLKDGVYTGGNLVLIRTSQVKVAAEPARAFFEARKSPLQLAGLIGPGTLLKLVMRRLTISEVEKKMSKILGIACKAVLTAYPEIGADVDKESDYNLISARLRMAR